MCVVLVEFGCWNEMFVMIYVEFGWCVCEN